MSGRKDLTSRTWRAQTTRIKARDGHTCQACGATTDLTVDHITPPSVTEIPGDQYPDHMLITLCRPCNSRKSNRINARLPYQNPKYK